ncbi:MAG: ABC transporter substrate-binding protein [Sedimenticolaceae bacterium]
MKSLYWLLAGVLFAGGVHAFPQYGPGPAPYMPGPVAAPKAANPAVAVRTGMDKLLSFLDSSEAPSPEALASFLNTEIAPSFDFDYMARSAGGRLYEGASPAEQAAMAEDIKRSFLTKMAEKLSAYDKQQVRFLPPRPGNDGQTAQVSVMVMNPGNYPARLDFRLYRDGSQWKVFDVAANGQSAIVHYRRQMMREMQQRQMRQMRRMAPPRYPGAVPGGYGPPVR